MHLIKTLKKLLLISLISFGTLELISKYLLGFGDPVLYKMHPTIEYEMVPSQKVRRFHRDIFINSESMRSNELDKKKKSNTTRILIYGDSVIFGGSLVDQEDLATQLLYKRLNDKDSRYEIANISAGSWGPGNWLAHLKERGNFNADKVILVLNTDDYKDNPKEGISLFYSKLISVQYTLNGFEGDISFAEIVFPYIFVAIFTGWFTRIYGLKWREAITFNYIPRWQSVEEEIEGASQRIQDDCYKFAKIVESLGLQVIRAIMTLIAFIPILWGLSDKVDIPILRDIEGSLVWFSLIVSLGGLIVSWFVGIKLPGLEYNNQRVEAAFRKDLVLGEDNKKDFAQTSVLKDLFTGIKYNYNRLFLHYGYFDGWMTTYDQFMIIAPYLIMGPGLFTGLITLGVLVQVSNAFARVHGGFALFLHNWTTITELRSIYKRLSEFEYNLEKFSKTRTA